ncbi:MAG: DNA repair protein RecN [Candidatus Cloacimonetes bacterium]|nr:DNA repair protein RecN [Candidatus Cloacimonadota bacterium]
MLKDLKIKNFVLVKDMNISFGQNLTVLTGETGAGKSVIAGALQLVLGEQIKHDVFYNNHASVELEAIFDVSNLKANKNFQDLLEKYGVEIEISNHKSQITGDLYEMESGSNHNKSLVASQESAMSELFFYREIKPDGRSSIFINGRKSTNAIVKDFRNILLDFHSQRDQHSLFDEDIQLLYLDNYANLMSLRDEFQKNYNLWTDYTKKLKKYQDDNQKNKEKIMLYQYQIDELENANLKENEEAELDKEYNLLSNAKDILNLFYEMKAEFFEAEKTIYDIFGFYKNRFVNYVNDSKLIKDNVENLSVCITALEDIMSSLRFLDDEIPTDPKRLEEVESRLKTLYDLKTKYKKDIVQMNEYLNEMKSFIGSYEQDIETEEKFKAEIDSLRQKTFEIALELENKRIEAATDFQLKIIDSLRNLAINEADFKIVVERSIQTTSSPLNKNALQDISMSDKDINSLQIEDFCSTGFNRVKYIFSANKGMALQDLKSTISGGELSRLLLVIKSILAKKLPERTIIFDEIDAGIGGKTANTLGVFIKDLSHSHQILCISHLPQIAAIADNHLLITKISLNDKSAITMNELSHEERREEIARMLSGNVTDTALEHADELLKK